MNIQVASIQTEQYDKPLENSSKTIKRYNVLYCDPPWSYKNKNTGGSLVSGAAAKYPTLTQEDLKTLPIKDIADKDSVLFLWATVPLLPEALDVMNAWGFKYKTMLTWHKSNYGLGYWFRGQTEHLLFGTRGKITAFRSKQVNFIESPTLKHSEKPLEFKTLIEEVTKTLPDRRMVELFSRAKQEGWDAIGNEIDGQDIREVLKGIIE